MNRTSCSAAAAAVIVLTLASGLAVAQQPAAAPAQTITRAGEQASIAGPAEYFTGRARIDPVWPADQNINASGGLVTFEPRAFGLAHPSRGPAPGGHLGRGTHPGMGQAHTGNPPRRRGLVPARCQALARRRPGHGDDPPVRRRQGGGRQERELDVESHR